MATDLLSVACRGRKEKLSTYSFGRVGLGVVVLSIVVICMLASSSSISVVSGLRFWFGVGVVMGGAGGVCAAESYEAWRNGEVGIRPPLGRVVS